MADCSFLPSPALRWLLFFFFRRYTDFATWFLCGEGLLGVLLLKARIFDKRKW